MKRIILVFMLSVPFYAGAQTKTFKERVLQLVVNNHSGPNFAVVSVKLRLGVDVEAAYKQLDTLLARPYGDMFWMYGCAGLYLATQDVLRPEYKARVRECWKHFTPYRGDTENHFLMYYGSLLLMSEMWPDVNEQEWFTGQSSKEIHEQAKDYLDHWIDETVKNGQIEWDSPRYAYYFITPLVLLANYERDTTLKRRFKMMLEYELADYAIDYLDGNYCGAHSRVSDQAAIDPKSAEATSYGEYFFADTVSHLQPDIAFAALGSFSCPEIIRSIATDRSKPYFSLELKRGRTTIRGSDVRNAAVYKRSYMTSEFCLGSMQGGIVQPIQQQSWSLVFKSKQPNNIIFSLHPNVDSNELAMFFPEEPSFMMERISSVKAGYPSENKWVGGSPYEHIYQTEHQLVAHYEIPKEAKYHHVDLFIPHNREVVFLSNGSLSADRNGWIKLRCNKTLVGIHVPSGGEWSDEGSHYRVRFNRDTVMIWLIAEVLGDRDPNQLARAFTNAQPIVKGNSREFKQPFHDDERILLNEGSEPKPKESMENMLFDSPFMTSRAGSGMLELHTQKEKLTLDFNKNVEY